MYNNIKENLQKYWYEILLTILFVSITILFFVATLGIVEFDFNNEGNDNNEIKSDLISLSTYNNEVVNLASPNLEGKEYLGNGVYKLHTQNGGILSYNIYNGEYRVYGDLTGSLLYQFGYSRPSANDAYIQAWKTNQVVWENAGVINLFGGAGADIDLNKNTDYSGLRPSFNSSMHIYVSGVFGEIDVYFKIQLEEGSQATNFQVPIQALEQHNQLEYNKAYQEGYDTGYIDGVGSVVKDFVDGNEWNFLQYEQSYGTNVNVNMSSNYLTTFIDIPVKLPKENGFNYLQMNLGFLKNLRLITEQMQEGSTPIGIHFSLRNENNQELTKVWNILDDDYQILYKLPYLGAINTIRLNIVYAVENPNMTELQRMQQQSIVSNLINQLTNEGKYFIFYIKEGIVFDTEILGQFIDYQKNIIHLDYATYLIQEYEKGLKKGLDDGWDDGYKEGMKINPNDNFGSMIKAILLGVGTVLGIQLLPNITIGAIIAVPIVFGIIAFVLGRRKE